MTKRITAILLCIITLLLAGCSAKTEKPEAESTTAESTISETTTAATAEKPEEPKEDIMSIIDATRNANIKITLPEGNELDGAARDIIMKKLKDDVFRIYDRNTTDLTVELKAEELTERDGFVSMVFRGTSAVKGVDEKALTFTVNVDKDSVFAAGLADIYKINDDFLSVFESYAGGAEYTADDLTYADTFMSSVSSYLTKDELVVLLAQSNEKITIPADSIKDLLITESDTAALLDSFKANAESDNNAKWLSAFFSGDFNTCASMIGAEVSALALLTTVEFGSVRMREITITDSYGYSYLKDEITFTVTESQFKSLPVGKYTYRMIKAKDSLFNVGSWERLSEAVSVPEDAMTLLRHMLFYAVPHNVYGYTLSDSEKNLFEHGVSDLIFSLDSSIGDGDGMMTADEFSAAAKELFGLDSWKPSEKYASETDGGLWQQKGHGGPHARYDVTRVIKRDDKLEVYVQVYGDYMSLSRSYTVRFTLAKTDSIYGYRFDKIEYTDKGDCEPWRFMN